MGFGTSAARMSLAMSQIASPDREGFNLGTARLAYVEGHIELDEFERSAEHVLAGGTVDQYGRIRTAAQVAVANGLTTLNEARR